MTHRLLCAAIALTLAASPAFADDAALRAEVDALRSSIEAQRAQLAAQAKLLEQQQASSRPSRNVSSSRRSQRRKCQR